ncbi:MAG: hypothetical protein K2Q14_08430 [Gammaproteobacteria bacterium]|nr:hypothetical protein [Gammaproteobacteria bacterium]
MNKNELNQAIDWGTLSEHTTHWSLKGGPIINHQNKGVYMSGVWMLGGIGIISLLGIIGLSACQKEIPQALIALGSVAVGALGGLFTHK